MTYEQPRVPVTILTGFLGAGKTTLLNYILTEKHGHRIAVIENEFGEVDVDSDLVMTSKEEIFQIVNGCICCVVDVRTDLVRILQQLLERKDQFDHILVETSGLADPTPVAATFYMDHDVARKLELDGIVTLIDALHIEQHLDDPSLARHDNQAIDQIVAADRIILNKTDLVDTDQLVRIEQRIRLVNASAQILRCSHARVNLDHILGIQGFAPSSLSLSEPDFLDDDGHVCDEHCDEHGDEHCNHDQEHPREQPHPTHASVPGHEHDPSVTSVSLLFDQPFERARLDVWLAALVAADGDHLFRLKGIVWIRDHPQRHVLQAVHRVLDLRAAEPWTGTAPRSKFVFIGRHLNRAFLRAGLGTCRAGHGPLPEPDPETGLAPFPAPVPDSAPA